MHDLNSTRLKARIIRAANWAKSSVMLKLRLVNARRRVLPSFIIIGAQKSGTSSLYYYLRQHPQIHPSFLKEIHYFDGGLNRDIDNYKKGLLWYKAFFPKKADIETGQMAFEASPMYFFNPLVPKRIADQLPDVKLIALLRNPINRAISHYYHENKLGFEDLPIMEAFKKEESRLEESVLRKDYKSKAFVHFSYKSRGRYHEQLSRYFKLFGRENILVIKSEEFFKNTQSELKRILAFLGVNQTIEFSDFAVHGKGKNRTEVSQKVYDFLNEYFEDENKKLAELLGEDYYW